MSSGLLSGEHFFDLRIDLILAYGRYNDLVLQVSGARGQSVAIWDFEWVHYLWRTLFLKFNRYGNLFSSQDSSGAGPETPKALYDERINQHPSTILALNHETIGSFALF